MPENEPSNEKGDKHEFVVGGSLSEVPTKSSRPLDEMVECSLVSIRTGKQLSTMHRIGEHGLCDPDYRLVCAWAEQTGKSNEDVLEALLKEKSHGGFESVIEEGRFVEISVEGNELPINSLPNIEGLVIEILNVRWVGTLTELDLNPVPNLTRLACMINDLTELDIRPLQRLKYDIPYYDEHKTRLIKRDDQNL